MEDSADRIVTARGYRAARAILAMLLGFALLACGASREEKRLFHEGRTLVTEGHYEASLPSLRQYLETYPRGSFASRAWLFLGKSEIALGRFAEARAAFDACISEFPESLEAHKSRYKLALLDLLEGDLDTARRRFEELRSHPDGPLAGEAAAFARYLEDAITTQTHESPPALGTP